MEILMYLALLYPYMINKNDENNTNNLIHDIFQCYMENDRKTALRYQRGFHGRECVVNVDYIFHFFAIVRIILCNTDNLPVNWINDKIFKKKTEMLTKIIFGILCGCLYVVGFLFGWDYQKTSVIVCLRWWPWICCLSTLPIILGLLIRIGKKKKMWLSLYLLPVSILYSLMYYLEVCCIYATYPPRDIISIYPPRDMIKINFMDCMNDLQNIANACGTTYENVNLIIYVELFILILLLNGALTYMAIPKRTTKKKTALQ